MNTLVPDPHPGTAASTSPADDPRDTAYGWLVAPLLQALGLSPDDPALAQALREGAARLQAAPGPSGPTAAQRVRPVSTPDVDDRVTLSHLQQEMASLELDLPRLMDAVVERALGLTSADGCALELLEENGTVVMRSGSGLMASFVGKRSGSADGLLGLTLTERRVMVCADVRHDTRVDQALAVSIGARGLVMAPLRSGHKMVGVLVAVYAAPHAFVDRDVGNLQLLGESLGVIIDRHRMHARLRASESKYRLLFDRNPQPMFVADRSSLRILAANRAAAEQYGYDEAELLGMAMPDLLAAKELRGRIPVPGARYGDLQLRHRTKEGVVFDVALSGASIDFDDRPARLIRCTDVTQRLRAQRDLRRVSRAQRMLSACNESQVRAGSEHALLMDLCRIAVDIGGYRMAWAGYALDDADKNIQMVASVGDRANYLSEDFRTSWSDQVPHGRGPAGVTIRTGEMVIVEDVRRDPASAPWASRAIEHGFRGVICLPLRDGEHTFGLLYLYSGEVASPSPDEVVLLNTLANDLTFGLVTLRARDQQRRAQETQQRIQTAMLKVAAAVSASTGTEFFEQLARNMADALGAQAGFIATLVHDAPLVARAVGAVVRGQVRRNFDAQLDGTRLAALLAQGRWIVEDGVPQECAPFPLLRAIGAQVYAGHALTDGAGRVTGFVLVAFSKPLAEREFIESTLRIFAVRVAAELDRRQADEHIRHQASLLDKARDAIVVCDIDDRVVYWNKSAELLYGWDAAEALGQPVAGLLADDGGYTRHAHDQLMANGEWTGEVSRRRKMGEPVQVEARWTLVRDDQGAPQSVLMIDTDITQRKASEAKIQKLAFYDPLTSLPNRQLLQDRLHHALATTQRHANGGALLCIDLDNFKTLNDTLGHDKGDMLLQQVAMRLVSCVRELDTVARLGGDEFVVVLEELTGTAEEVAGQARRIGEKILNTLAEPYKLEGYEYQSTASMGVARFGPDTESVGELLKHADIAMYQAKNAGRHTLRFFDPDLQAAVTARAAMEGDLRQAFVQREFLLHYQPQVDEAGRITGVEALARWHSPQRGMVSPAEFIPLAEETGLILLLGHRVLEIACTLLASWRHRPDTGHLTMAVNVSARQFRHADFVRQVGTVLEQTGANPERLKLELTESVLVDDMQSIVSKMAALKAMGVRFALDDFGTGYSSLTYLKQLPLDQLKIDQSFVRDVLTDANDAAIARTVIGLARSLGLGVIAEGVETSDQRDFLTREGCHAFQGYYYSRPLRADALEELLSERGATCPVQR